MPEETEQFHNRIRYAGQQYDDLTEQYYMRARYYNPVLGRFLQEDVYQGDGLNSYVYCGNNPVGYCDPSGDVVPSTGYRYMSSDRALDAFDTGSQYATYIGFDKFDSAVQVQDAFQIAPEWSDCEVRGTFDTLQVVVCMFQQH